ncbi:MAG: Ig-like domain-containing protein [Lachnospiraceae bacterium]|nr:Ig-like domain-containing protein [Lachnospiraceae bacterium]
MKASKVTADINLYAKWAASAMNPIPEITDDTKELYLVKGQSFPLPEGTWKTANKKYVTIKKNVLSAKKETKSGPVEISLEGSDRKIKVYVVLPSFAKKKVTFNAGDKDQSLGFKLDAPLAVQWATSDPDVATVSQNGAVTAVAKGKAVIKAYVNGKSYSCTVNIKETTAVAERTIHLNLRGKKKISLKGYKVNKMTWSVSDNTIAKVEKGKIIAESTAGKTTVTGTIANKVFTFHVFVEDIAIKTGKIEAAKGQNKYKLTLDKAGDKAKIEFNNVSRPVVFKSSKGVVAYVDKEGNVIANGKGKAKLTTKLNGKTITITVNVKN